MMTNGELLAFYNEASLAGQQEIEASGDLAAVSEADFNYFVFCSSATIKITYLFASFEFLNGNRIGRIGAGQLLYNLWDIESRYKVWS